MDKKVVEPCLPVKFFVAGTTTTRQTKLGELKTADMFPFF